MRKKVHSFYSATAKQSFMHSKGYYLHQIVYHYISLLIFEKVYFLLSIIWGTQLSLFPILSFKFVALPVFDFNFSDPASVIQFPDLASIYLKSSWKYTYYGILLICSHYSSPALPRPLANGLEGHQIVVEDVVVVFCGVGGLKISAVIDAYTLMAVDRDSWCRIIEEAAIVFCSLEETLLYVDRDSWCIVIVEADVGFLGLVLIKE